MKKKHESPKVLDKYHQTLLKENMKTAPDKSHHPCKASKTY